MTVILLVSCGVMGAALGQLLVLGGHRVLFPASGRSQATLDRAAAAGIDALPLTHQQVWQTRGTEIELVLSILPPSQAVSFAEEVAQYSKDVTTHHPLFIELNAVSPETAEQIRLILAESCAYMNGSIIGMPPTYQDVAMPSIATITHNPCIYLSAMPDAQTHLAHAETLLRASGWKVRTLPYPSTDEHPQRAAAVVAAGTAAKSLKLCYSSIAKGVMALATSAALTSHATSPALSQALATELTESLPGLASFIAKQMQHVVPKSARFVGEMREIAGLTQSTTHNSQIGAVWTSIAELYHYLGDQQDGAPNGDLIHKRLCDFGALITTTMDANKHERELA